MVVAIDGVLSCHGIALAQVMEQNPAPLIFGDQKQTLGTEPLDLGGDDTPIGVLLTSLAVVDARSDETAREAADDRTSQTNVIDLSRADPKIQASAFREQLAPFIGQPLSEKLLNEVRAVLVRQYRALDRPFVAVTVPPQDVSDGALRLEVTEFRVGRVRTEGNAWTSDRHLHDTVDLRDGDAIAARRLIADLNWLNLNPYRNLGAVFEPGTVPGTTDIILRSEERRPWSVYAGWSNTGTPGNGRHRVFTGVNLANLPLLDHQISYKVTANPDSLHHGDWIGVDRAPGYVSHAASYFAPLDVGSYGRVKLWVTAGYVESGTVIDDVFTQFGKSWSIANEVAVPLILPPFTNFDLFLGADVKRQMTTLAFDGESVLETPQGVGQVRGGVRAVTRYALGPADNDLTIEASVVGSPGNLVPDSTAYVYGRTTVRQVSRFDNGFGLAVTLTGQATADALPSLEKTAFGGTSGLRGYETNELVGDSGIQGSLDVLLPVMTVEPFGAGLTVSAQPYGFFDGGYVWDDTRPDQGVRSLGAGLTLSLSRHASATVEAGYTLDDGPQTDRGATSVMGTVTVRY